MQNKFIEIKFKMDKCCAICEHHNSGTTFVHLATCSILACHVKYNLNIYSFLLKIDILCSELTSIQITL